MSLWKTHRVADGAAKMPGAAWLTRDAQDDAAPPAGAGSQLRQYWPGGPAGALLAAPAVLGAAPACAPPVTVTQSGRFLAEDWPRARAARSLGMSDNAYWRPAMHGTNGKLASMLI
jgi:hypothetical protein